MVCPNYCKTKDIFWQILNNVCFQLFFKSVSVQNRKILEIFLKLCCRSSIFLKYYCTIAAIQHSKLINWTDVNKVNKWWIYKISVFSKNGCLKKLDFFLFFWKTTNFKTLWSSFRFPTSKHIEAKWINVKLSFHNCCNQKKCCVVNCCWPHFYLLNLILLIIAVRPINVANCVRKYK